MTEQQLRRKERQKRYSLTEAGKATSARAAKRYRTTEAGKAYVHGYNISEKGKAVQKRYGASEKGKLVRRRYLVRKKESERIVLEVPKE